MSAEVVVVVPVYGDIPSVLDCLTALRTSIDPERHRVLIVNDCGPEVDAMEAAILDLVAGDPTIRYERNDSNLGFVGTCNRAVLELDTSDADVLLLNSDAVPTPGFLEELQRVLALDDRNGAVAPRSNNATIASLPHRLSDSSAERTFERTQQVFNAVSPLLPEYYEVPVAMGFCLLIKRRVIREYGLFDEAFAPGYGEENDFCLRIGLRGYRSLIANRVVVFHAGSKSFRNAQRNKLRRAHQRILDRRYPWLQRALDAFLTVGSHPVDRFSDCLVRSSETFRVLVDLRFLPQHVVQEQAEEWEQSLRTRSNWDVTALVRPAYVDSLATSALSVLTESTIDRPVHAVVIPRLDTSPAVLIHAIQRSPLVIRAGTEPSNTEVLDRMTSTAEDDVRAILGALPTAPDAASVCDEVERWYGLPLANRSAELEGREAALAIRSLQAADAARHQIDDDAVNAARRLAAIERSRSFRLISLIARLRRRLVKA